MKTRLAAVLALLLAAVVGLSACGSQIGTAANVDGHKITDSDVDAYLTAKAVPFSHPSSGDQIVPRSFVLTYLVRAQLFDAVLDASGGTPTADEQKKATADVTGGQPDDVITEAYTRFGFAPDFAELAVNTDEKFDILLSRFDITTSLKPITQKIHELGLDVSTSGRYGSWDAANIQLDSSSGAGLPNFVQLVPASAGTTSAAEATTSAG